MLRQQYQRQLRAWLVVPTKVIWRISVISHATLQHSDRAIDGHQESGQELLQRWLSAAGAPGLQPWQGLLPALSGSSLQQRSPPLMAIRLGLQLNKAFYEPGEPAIVTVKVRSVAWCPCARTESERACAACAPMRAQL